jgi:hypothetical protein
VRVQYAVNVADVVVVDDVDAAVDAVADDAVVDVD